LIDKTTDWVACKTSASDNVKGIQFWGRLYAVSKDTQGSLLPPAKDKNWPKTAKYAFHVGKRSTGSGEILNMYFWVPVTMKQNYFNTSPRAYLGTIRDYHWIDRDFQSAFPELTEIIPNLIELSLSKLEKEFQARVVRNRPSFSLFGLSIGANVIHLWGPLILFCWR